MSAKVLVVDDGKPMTDVVKMLLATDVFTHKVEHDGTSAIEPRVNETDIILLDVMMPSIDGFEVCRRLRRLESMHNVPIIMLTAKSQVEDKIVGFEAGADDYITKPFNNEELKVRVAARLRRTRSTVKEEHIIPGRVISVPLVLAKHRSGLYRRGYRITSVSLMSQLAHRAAIRGAAGPVDCAAVAIDSQPGLFVQKRTGPTVAYSTCIVPHNGFNAEVKRSTDTSTLTWPDFKSRTIAYDARRQVPAEDQSRRASAADHIIKGEMSIVGYFQHRSSPPTTLADGGLSLATGLWQVKGRNIV
jgi:DNA-binding response OmpR family regulator